LRESPQRGLAFISYSAPRRRPMALAGAKLRLKRSSLAELDVNPRAILCTVASALVLAGQPTFAQDGGDRTGHEREDQLRQNLQQDGRHDQYRRDEYRGDEYRGDDRRRQSHERRIYKDERDDRRGVGPEHAWHRGDRLPIEYRRHDYVVDDWRAHRLSAPPRGYHWVQVGGDYVLVAIATGVILELLLDH
jgi:Ni/Co efflux regulator RcnB